MMRTIKSLHLRVETRTKREVTERRVRGWQRVCVLIIASYRSIHELQYADDEESGHRIQHYFTANRIKSSNLQMSIAHDLAGQIQTSLLTYSLGI